MAAPGADHRRCAARDPEPRQRTGSSRSRCDALIPRRRSRPATSPRWRPATPGRPRRARALEVDRGDQAAHGLVVDPEVADRLVGAGPFAPRLPSSRPSPPGKFAAAGERSGRSPRVRDADRVALRGNLGFGRAQRRRPGHVLVALAQAQRGLGIVVGQQRVRHGAGADRARSAASRGHIIDQRARSRPRHCRRQPRLKMLGESQPRL